MSKYLDTILARCRGNFTVFDAFTKADSVINDPKYKNIMCSVSGGADSDVMLDLIHRVDIDEKVKYVWFNTGLEYQATKDHLDYLEDRYDITIHRERAIKPIPLCCKEYGQPFLNKYVSYMIKQLQEVNFTWEDLEYEELIKLYPNRVGAIKWWCNCKGSFEDIETSKFNIRRNKWLKEFLLANPPQFRISNKCCDYAKKDVAHKLIKDTECDLMIVGIRKAEGGIRSSAYKNCYSINETGTSYYRPLFWFLDTDKKEYKNLFNIKHSDCYEKWGFDRTGCVGCPYSKNLFTDLSISEQYEPNLIKACRTVFKDSYEYTKQYRQFVKEMTEKETGLTRLF